MNFKLYKALVKDINIGKQLPDAIYLHKDALCKIPIELQQFIPAVAKALNFDDNQWNLVKLFKSEFRISLLSYPSFYSDSYPVLEQSVNVDLSKLSYKTTCYRTSNNPPILHRKETMILPESDYYQYFAALTKEGEDAALYENTRVIGFKQSWLNLINKKGYQLIDGRIVKFEGAQDAPQTLGIERYRTAIVRYELSRPIKSLANNGYLDGRFSIFDYGCGRGDDLRELVAHGINALGWDPIYLPDSDKVCSDIVNLGFVLNVIEDKDERLDTLLDAWFLTKKILVVSVMLVNVSYQSKFQSYNDGVITSRNTFQKYYSQSEIKEYLNYVLNESVIAISPGVFYIFKDKSEEQIYLQAKYQRHHSWLTLTKSKPIDSKERVKLLVIQNKVLFDAFWAACLRLGRVPVKDEFELTDDIRLLIGSNNKAFSLIQELFEINDFKRAAQARKEDLLVYLAMGLFDKRKPYTQLTESLKIDIKVFFGDFGTAVNLAKELLYAIANTELVNNECEKAYQQLPASILNQKHSLVFCRCYTEQLPLMLRVYVGAALQMYGELDDSIDLIKIHITSGKLTLIEYDDFQLSVPFLIKRIKIKMATQEIDFFDYTDVSRRPPLLNKHLLLDSQDVHYEKQKSFDKRLSKLLDIPLTSEVIFHRAVFDEKTLGVGKKISGFRIISCLSDKEGG